MHSQITWNQQKTDIHPLVGDYIPLIHVVFLRSVSIHLLFISLLFLDYALMGEYHDVAQFVMEQGGLSITGIQEIAACKLQVSLMSPSHHSML